MHTSYIATQRVIFTPDKLQLLTESPPPATAITILETAGFKKIDYHFTSFAEQFIGVGKFKKHAHPDEAPTFFDCATFTRYIFDSIGILLPRRPIQQYLFGAHVELENVKEGDLIFAEGIRNFHPLQSVDTKIGHVGLITNHETVIHASTPVVEEIKIAEFIAKRKFQGVRRIVENFSECISFHCPPHVVVDTSDDLIWIIARHLPKRA